MVSWWWLLVAGLLCLAAGLVVASLMASGSQADDCSECWAKRMDADAPERGGEDKQ